MDVADSLEVSEANPIVLASGGTASLDITSNAPWKVGKIDVDWLQTDITDGRGNASLQLTYSENSAVEPRTAEFFIVTTNDGAYQKVTLTQLATDPILALEEHDIEVGSRPRTHEINLNTNIPTDAVSVEIVYEKEEGDNWIVGVNVEANALKFQTTRNNLAEERAATIILSYANIGGEGSESWDKITVTQMASGNDGPPEMKDFNYVKALPLGIIDENISIVGNIVSTGVSDNFRKNTYIIQNDNISAIAFEAIENLPFDRYEKVHLLLDGAQVETFEDCGVQYKVIRGLSNANILAREPDANFRPQTMHISALNDEHLLAVVALEDIEFALPHGGYSNFHEYYVTQSYANYITKHYPAPLRDVKGDDIYLITNREVSYRRKSVPKGAGTLTGLIVKINDSPYGDLGQFAIRHLQESDIALDPDRANGFSDILVEWELTTTKDFPNGTPNLPPTTGPSTATLQKDEGTGFFDANTLNGIYLIAKYRGDNPGSATIIDNSSYNVNSWGTGRYWIMDNVSTLGITSSLFLQFEAVSINSTGTGGGPRDFAVEYSLDGDNWTRVANYQLTGQIAPNQTNNATSGLKIFTYRLPDELLNKPNIKIRLLNTSNTSVNGGTIAIPGSTSRLAHFSIRYNK